MIYIVLQNLRNRPEVQNVHVRLLKERIAEWVEIDVQDIRVITKGRGKFTDDKIRISLGLDGPSDRETIFNVGMCLREFLEVSGIEGEVTAILFKPEETVEFYEIPEWAREEIIRFESDPNPNPDPDLIFNRQVRLEREGGLLYIKGNRAVFNGRRVIRR